jgi:hypothetical protein
MEEILRKVRSALVFLKLFVYRNQGHLFVMRPTPHMSTLLFFLLSIQALIQAIATVLAEVDSSVSQLCLRSRIGITGRLEDSCPDTPLGPLGFKYYLVPLVEPSLLSSSE